MLNEILEIASKYADSAEVYYLESHSSPVNFEVNKLKSMESKDVRGVGLRVIKDGKIGFSSTTDLDPGKFKQLVKFAVDVAEFGTPATWNFPVHPIESTTLKMKKPPSIEDLVKTGESIIKAIREHEDDTLNNVSLQYNSSREIVMNTNGVSGHRERDASGFGLSCQLVRGTDILYIYEGLSTTDPELNYLVPVERLIDYLKHSKAIFQVNSKTMPVIFTPKGLSSFLIPLEPALNGKAVLKGSSYFTKKLGQKVMDERITIF